MYRAHPLTSAVLEEVRRGTLGRLMLIRASFCFRTMKIQDNIRFRPDMAGGSLMDVGCYCIDFARLVAGAEPVSVHAAGHLHESGVDDAAVGCLAFPGGVLATFSCGMSVQADNTASICGSEAYIEVPVPWKPPPKQAVYVIGRSVPPRMDGGGGGGGGTPPPPPRETHHVDAGMNLYGVEADHFAATVLDGRKPFMSRRDSIGNMVILDEMRKQIGVALG